MKKIIKITFIISSILITFSCSNNDKSNSASETEVKSTDNSSSQFIGTWTSSAHNDVIVISKEGSNFIVDVQRSYKLGAYSGKYPAKLENGILKVSSVPLQGATDITFTDDGKKFYFMGDEFYKRAQ